MTPFTTTDLSLLSELALSFVQQSEPFRAMLLSLGLFALSSLVRRRPWASTPASARPVASAAGVALNIGAPSPSENLVS
jgi:hypothetical protein